jgi:hypothetical protein
MKTNFCHEAKRLEEGTRVGGTRVDKNSVESNRPEMRLCSLRHCLCTSVTAGNAIVFLKALFMQ